MVAVRMGRARAGPGSFGLDGGSWTEDVSKPPLQSARTHNRPSDTQGVSIIFWQVSQGLSKVSCNISAVALVVAPFSARGAIRA